MTKNMIRQIDHPVLCTSIAQGEEMLKAGVDANTADMTWSFSRFTPKCSYGEEHHFLFCYPNAATSHDPVGKPCWSVNALMNLLLRTMQDTLDEEHELRLTIQPTMSGWSAFYEHDGRVGEVSVGKELTATLVSLIVKVYKIYKK